MQTFSELIRGDYIYIDKTEDIHNLFGDGGKYYFLSRPRRFGKSLLLSTMEEIFSGNKELFKGLWIYDRIEWEKFPIVHIDFTSLDYETDDLLKQSLEETLNRIAGQYGVQLTTVSYKTRFRELIEGLSTGGQVVILVDEYDKPIIDHISDHEKAETNRKVLANFYGVIKSVDKYIKFAFLTGVSKFTKVSVFSGLNNLRDITLSRQFSTLLGCTQQELNQYFSDYIDRLSNQTGFERELLLKKVREWYNGYSWDGENFVYNPFSLLNLFKENSFDNFWFSTGTPHFLIDLVKGQPDILPDLDRWPVRSYAFDSYDLDHIEITPLLFQTGYLTIKSIETDSEKKNYHLDYPNQEVRDSFLIYLLQEFANESNVFSSRVLERISRIIDNDDLDGLINEIKTQFAGIPFNIFLGKHEAYYHTVIYLVLKLAGADIRAEEPGNLGRVDAILESRRKIFVMEFKMGKGGEKKALAQIKDRKYHEKYIGGEKEIVLVGISFDEETRNLDRYIAETI